MDRREGWNDYEDVLYYNIGQTSQKSNDKETCIENINDWGRGQKFSLPWGDSVIGDLERQGEGGNPKNQKIGEMSYMDGP